MVGGKHWNFNDFLTGNQGVNNLNSLKPMGFAFQDSLDFNSLRVKFNPIHWVKNNGSVYISNIFNTTVPRNSIKYYWLNSNNILQNGNSFPTAVGNYFILSKITTNSSRITGINQFNYNLNISSPESGGSRGNLVVIKTTITTLLLETGISTTLTTNPRVANADNFLITLSRAVLIPGFDFNYNSTTKTISYVSTAITFKVGDVLIVRYEGI